MNAKSLFVLFSCWTLSCFASSAGEADDPQIAANGSGNLVAFWEEYALNHFSVRAAPYLVAGGGWQPAATISVGIGDAFDPEAVMNAAGNILAVWRQNTNGYYAVFAATNVLGSSWGAPVQLSTSDSAFAEVQIDADGNGVALWQEKGNKTFHISTASFHPVTGWGPVAQLSEASLVLMTPETAMGSNGRTVAVWSVPTVPGPLFGLAVQGAFYSAGAGWSTPTTLSNLNYDAVKPAVGVCSTGEALISWTAKGAEDGVEQVFVTSLSAGGEWGVPVAVSDPDANASFSYLAMNHAGQAVVVWQSQEAGEAVACKAITRSSDGEWGAIATIASSGVNRPEVAINGSGKAVVIWVEESDADARIKAAVYSGSAWGAPTTISDVGIYASHPEVRVSEDGSAAVVWQSEIPETISILSARLSAGNVWSSPVVIN